MLGRDGISVPSEGDQRVMTSGLHYSVRVSARAKRCIIRLRGPSLVEVVVPKSFAQTLIPQILEEQMDWIIRKQAEVGRLEVQCRPECIALESVGDTWTLTYQYDDTDSVSVRHEPWFNLHVF